MFASNSEVGLPKRSKTKRTKNKKTGFFFLIAGRYHDTYICFCFCLFLSGKAIREQEKRAPIYAQKFIPIYQRQPPHFSPRSLYAFGTDTYNIAPLTVQNVCMYIVYILPREFLICFLRSDLGNRRVFGEPNFRPFCIPFPGAAPFSKISYTEHDFEPTTSKS